MPGFLPEWRRKTRSFISGDPYFSSVGLLMHFDGPNDLALFTDSSPIPKTITIQGNSRLSTAQFKYGISSGYFDGNGDYLTIPDSTAFNLASSAFTIECWFYALSLSSSSESVLIAKDTYGFNFSWSLGVQSNAIKTVYSSAGATFISNVNIQPNTWNFIAFVSDGTSMYHYLNTALVGTLQNNTVQNHGSSVRIGAYSLPSNYFNGYIDEFRITKGVQRYSGSTIIPPGGPFSDF